MWLHHISYQSHQHHLAPSTSPPRASSSLSSPSPARPTMPELERRFTMFLQRFASFNVFRFERRFTFFHRFCFRFTTFRFVSHTFLYMFDAVLFLPFCCLHLFVFFLWCGWGGWVQWCGWGENGYDQPNRNQKCVKNNIKTQVVYIICAIFL